MRKAERIFGRHQSRHTMPGLPPQQYSFGKRIAIFLALTLGFIFLTGIFVVVLGTASTWLPNVLYSDQLSEFIYDWSAFLISVLIALRILEAIQQNWGWPALGFHQFRAGEGLLKGSLTAVGILLLCFLILVLGGWVNVVKVNFIPAALFGWILFFLIQPLAEEVVMRSFLQNYLHRYFGPWVGLFGSALVFGLLHTGNNAFTWIAGLEIMAGGVLMGLLFLHTENIWGTFAMHAVWNFLQSTILGFAVSGMDTYRVLTLEINGPTWLTGGDFGLEGSILSLLLLIAACWYFWPATRNDVPVVVIEKQQQIKADDILDESSTV